MTISVIMRWVSSVGRRADGFIDFESEQGSVGISTKAIKDFAEQTAKEFSAEKAVTSIPESSMHFARRHNLARNVRYVWECSEPNLTGTIYAKKPKGSLSQVGLRQKSSADYESWKPKNK